MSEVNYSGFDAMQFQFNGVFFYVPIDGMTEHEKGAVKLAIEGKINSSERPSATLVKALNRIAHHLEQLTDSTGTLFAAYQNMVKPAVEKKQSATYKARWDMLKAMPDKVLKSFAAVYIPDEVDNYILPDDREVVMKALMVALQEEIALA